MSVHDNGIQDNGIQNIDLTRAILAILLREGQPVALGVADRGRARRASGDRRLRRQAGCDAADDEVAVSELARAA